MNDKDPTQRDDNEVVLAALTAPSPDTRASEESSQPYCDRQRLTEGAPVLPVQRVALGEPIANDEVAQLLGCSPWTVRQRYLRQGLPYLQARPRGKIVFFREQVIAWIEKRQRQKGGVLR